MKKKHYTHSSDLLKVSEKEKQKETNETIRLYTDGSCYPNPNGPMGAGVVLVCKHYKLQISKYLGIGTNNIAELQAILVGLRRVRQRNRRVIVVTDSKYSINCITGKWNVNKNAALINYIRQTISRFNEVNFKWVKGHQNNRLNQEADQLAHRARTERKDYEKKFGYDK